MFAVYVIGMILFAVAIMRAGVLPRSAGVVLLIALLLKMFASAGPARTLALLGLAVAWGWAFPPGVLRVGEPGAAEHGPWSHTLAAIGGHTVNVLPGRRGDRR